MLIKRLDNIYKVYFSVEKNRMYKEQYITVFDLELINDYADQVSDFLLK